MIGNCNTHSKKNLYTDTSKLSIGCYLCLEDGSIINVNDYVAGTALYVLVKSSSNVCFITKGDFFTRSVYNETPYKKGADLLEASSVVFQDEKVPGYVLTSSDVSFLETNAIQYNKAIWILRAGTIPPQSTNYTGSISSLSTTFGILPKEYIGTSGTTVSCPSIEPAYRCIQSNSHYNTDPAKSYSNIGFIIAYRV